MKFEKGQRVKIIGVPKGEEALNHLRATVGHEGVVTSVNDNHDPDEFYDYQVLADNDQICTWGFMEDNLQEVTK